MIENPSECIASFGFGMWTCICIALICWILRLIGFIYHFFQYSEIQNFYQSALQISILPNYFTTVNSISYKYLYPYTGDRDLENLTWHEVQQKLRRAQKEYQICIHKQELTELDIYHRILR